MSDPLSVLVSFRDGWWGQATASNPHQHKIGGMEMGTCKSCA